MDLDLSNASFRGQNEELDDEVDWGKEPTDVNTPLAVSRNGGDCPPANLAASDAMQRAWTSYGARLKTQLNELKDQHHHWTREEFVMHLTSYKRLQAGTIQKKLAQLDFMERHSVFPVQLHKGPWALLNSFWMYIQQRELVEGAKPGALRNDHKAIHSLGDFLGIPKNIWPTAPTEPMTDERFIPSPDEVHALLHADYTPSPRTSYENHLIKGLLALDFLFGVRMPSEAFALKLKDFDPARHTCVVTEPKKSGRRRTVLVEPEWICCSTRHPSLANYLVWRRKVDPEGKEAAFFLQADGKPFASKDTMRNFLSEKVKPHFPWFYPYLGRHWSTTARLIDWDGDYARVADWHGHEDVNMTRREYEHNTRILRREHGDDWLFRAGRKHKTNRKPKTALSVRSTGKK